MKEYTVTNTRPMTVEEYIEFEENSEVRHELIENQLYPMPGTTDDHNDICINLTQLLKMLLKTIGKFKVHQENVKVQILHEKDYTYPDVMVVSDPQDFDARYIKKYPPVIFEVISKTTRMDDQVDKFIRYKNIAALQNYILVDSEKVLVEVRCKTTEGNWEANTYLRSDGHFPIPAQGIDLNIEDVYEGVSFL